MEYVTSRVVGLENIIEVEYLVAPWLRSWIVVLSAFSELTSAGRSTVHALS